MCTLKWWEDIRFVIKCICTCITVQYKVAWCLSYTYFAYLHSSFMCICSRQSQAYALKRSQLYILMKCVITTTKTHISSLFRRLPPYGRNGRCPVATWYNVTPILHRSTVALNCLPDGRLNTALSYMSGFYSKYMQTQISILLQNYHNIINA